ncbi:hypothetical protein EII12_04630 [Buchananella hordeovulneris]|uniref:DUF6493 family protein n=1 Tax=Buchananella hordeovulneris TaxID=52770 RepID=UPI000F5E9391|nr:DUF6493 family protein [Buchananella hordeovulneris]RRD52464.1 hypothetical protein EII12_04630 [Buchananella hordeovulneris]
MHKLALDDQVATEVKALLVADAPLVDIYRHVRERWGGAGWLARMRSGYSPHVGLRFFCRRLAMLFDDHHEPVDDDYILEMINLLNGDARSGMRGHLLRHDAEFREQIFWRIFEVEGGGEVSLANLEKFNLGSNSWAATVQEMIVDGLAPRPRVLRACLEALNRDFSAYRAGWYSRLYTALAPSAREAAADQDLLLQALGSGITATVTLAVKQLAALARPGLLDAAAFAAACAPALASTKSSALATIRVVAGANLAATERAEALAPALTHPHDDVQRAAARALLELGARTLLQAHAEVMAPAVVAELGLELPAVPVPPVAAAHAPAGPTELHSLVPWSQATASERLAALLEGSGDACELELALAWLARTPDARACLQPLQRRARRLVQRNDDLVAHLVLALTDDWQWCPPVERSTLPHPTWPLPPGDGPVPGELAQALPVLYARIGEVLEIQRGQRVPQELLATPTRPDGWLELPELARRVAALPGAPLPADAAQALARLRAADVTAGAELLGLRPPAPSSCRLEWSSAGSSELNSRGEPRWVWWDCRVVPTMPIGDARHQPGAIGAPAFPALTPLLAHAIVLACPSSTLPLVGMSMLDLNGGTQDATARPDQAILQALACHPGQWTEQTAQMLALGLASKRRETAALAAELFAQAIPGRLPLAQAAAGFAAAAPAMVLSRWAAALRDAAELAPHSVVDLLTALLPRLSPSQAGLNKLLILLRNEATRLGRPVVDPTLRAWLEQFTGPSVVAKAARALLD